MLFNFKGFSKDIHIFQYLRKNIKEYNCQLIKQIYNFEHFRK